MEQWGARGVRNLLSHLHHTTAGPKDCDGVCRFRAFAVLRWAARLPGCANDGRASSSFVWGGNHLREAVCTSIDDRRALRA